MGALQNKICNAPCFYIHKRSRQADRKKVQEEQIFRNPLGGCKLIPAIKRWSISTGCVSTCSTEC